MAKVKRHAFDVVQLETFEPVVKELEDLERLVLVFEQNSAQGRRQRQSHKTRKHHGNSDGHSKLTIQLTGNTAQERHRCKYRTQH